MIPRTGRHAHRGNHRPPPASAKCPEQVALVVAGGRPIARRWTDRPSGHSAVRDTTTNVLIIAEALHPSASTDVPRLTATLADELAGRWPVKPATAVLTRSAPRFDVAT